MTDEMKNNEDEKIDWDEVIRDLKRSGASGGQDRSTVEKTVPIFTPLRTLLNEPEEEATWVVDGLLPSGGFSIIAAKPKVGKSTVVRQLALCVARGEPFLGRETTKGVVLYVSLEDKRSEVKKHFKLMGATGSEDIEIYVGALPEKAQRWLESEMRRRQPALVIIDTLFRFVPVANVNDYAQVTAALSPLLALAREYSAHVLVVHHGRKGGGEGGDATLGSTAIFGTVDTSISLRRTDSKRTIETQQRYGADMESTVLVFDESTKSVALGGTKEQEDIRDIETAILDFLTLRSDPIDEPAINDGVNGRTGLKRNALRDLVTKGEIARTGGGRRGDPFLYSRSLVPDIYVGREKQEMKSAENPDSTSTISRSQDLPLPIEGTLAHKYA